MSLGMDRTVEVQYKYIRSSILTSKVPGNLSEKLQQLAVALLTTEKHEAIDGRQKRLQCEGGVYGALFV